MWLEPLSHVLIAVALLGQTTAGATLPKPIVFQQTSFAIPFRVDPVADPAQQPVEVQLYVSTDRGRRWQLYAKAPPTQQHFLFRAGGDGEFWFAIRVVDRSGQLRPEAISGPGLRVKVDTRLADKPKPPAQRDRVVARPPTKPSQDAEPSRNDEPKGSVAIAINPAIGGRRTVPTRRSAGQTTGPSLPSGERLRAVNSRSFQLEYEVDSVGPSGIGRVDLWGTRDGGKTWRSFHVNSNHSNTLLVNVDEEGVYGFRVVVANGAGLGGRPPENGDLPDLWIGVDLTEPTARIVSAQQGVDDEAGRMIVSWQADDRTLAARPVSLSFSQNRGGPWLPIASGLENTGRYAWPIDNRTPPRVYLRLEVRDEAGNVGIYETPEPVTIDQSQPTIRVRAVRPVG